MIELHAVFDLINTYLETGSSRFIKRLQSEFHFYYIDHEDSFHSYHVSSYDKKSQDALRKIIKKLDIQGDIFPQGIAKLTIKEVLFELCKKTDDPLILNVTEVIEKENSKKKLILKAAGVFVGVTFLGLLSNGFFRSFFESCMLIVASSTNSIPVIRLLTDTGMFAFRLFGLQNNQKVNNKIRIQQALFMFGQWFCNVIAYSVILANHASLPWVGFLFLMGSVVMVGHHLFSLTKKIQQLTVQNSNHQHQSLEMVQSQIRLMFGYKQQRNQLITDLVAAILMVGIVAIACFVPGGPLVFVSCLAAMIVCNITKSIISKSIKNKSEQKLKSALKASLSDEPVAVPSSNAALLLRDVDANTATQSTQNPRMPVDNSSSSSWSKRIFQSLNSGFFVKKIPFSKNKSQKSEKIGDISSGIC